MHILYVASSTIPSRTANSIHVMKMCQAFCQLGHQVELCVPRYDNPSVPEPTGEIWEHYGIRGEFPIRWLSTTARYRGYDFAARAVRYAHRVRAELVYTRTLSAAVIAAMWGIPTIYEIHEPPRTAFNRLSYRLLMQGRGLRRLVVITQALKDLLAAKTAGKDVLVLPDGVDLERFEDMPAAAVSRQRLGLSDAPLTLGYAGHLYAGRGIELILELARRFPQFQFLIAGGNDQDIDRYRQQTRDDRIANVLFLGFIPNAKLPQYLAACEVLLMPYQRNVAASGGQDTMTWASPLKMFEYMATGRLIIASDLPVLREILSPANCVLCPPDCVDAWQQAIERAAALPEWREAIGAQARQDVTQYSWTRRAQRALAGIT